MMNLLDWAEPYKRIMSEWRKGLAFFAAHPDGSVRMNRLHDYTRDAFMRAFRTAIHRGINAKGGTIPREPRDEEYRLRRDHQRIHDHLQRRIIIRGVPETRLVRRRPQLAALWRSHSED